MTHRSKLNRRQFLQGLGVGSTALLVAACAQPTPAAKAPEPTKAPAAQAPAATKAPEPTKAAEPTKAPAATKAPEPTKAPAPAGGSTLTYWVGMNQNVGATLKSFGEMTCYKELEKATGVKIEFQHPPIGQDAEQFNLLVASGKFPDIIEHYWTGAPGGPAKYLRDGVIVKLNDMIDKQAPNLKKVFTEHADWRRQILTDEGDVYGFPFFRADPFLMVFQGPIIRKDWLDKVGMQMPVTMDDWYAVLKAFKEKDPNGNGKADEFAFSPMLYGQPLNAFQGAGAFVGAYGVTYGFYQVKGVVKYGPLEPAFKDFLKTMAQWYKDGLVDPDFPTMDQKLMDAKVTGNQLGSFVQNTGGGIGKYQGLMKEKDPKFQLVAAPYPVLKKGDKPIFGQRDFNFNGLSASITTANKKVADSIKVLDYGYGPEGHMLFNFGVAGLTYNLVNGYPKYTDLITNNPNKLPLQQSMGQHFRSNFAGPMVQDKRYMEQYAALPEQQDSLKIWSEPSNEYQMPLVTPTQDESKKFASVMTEVNTRCQEAVTKIITGQQPVDGWDAVVKELKGMGIEDAIKIQQAALERFNKRP
jgi:putative aldouronate transport system substrate-binding protein